jgi:hypothetical protein
MKGLLWMDREELCSLGNAGVCDFVNHLTRWVAEDVNGVTNLKETDQGLSGGGEALVTPGAS